jgi:hypothetical protein
VPFVISFKLEVLDALILRLVVVFATHRSFSVSHTPSGMSFPVHCQGLKGARARVPPAQHHKEAVAPRLRNLIFPRTEAKPPFLEKRS